MELVMNQRVIWDRTKIKEIEEAKQLILGFRRDGYEIMKTDGTPMERFNPCFEEVIVKASKVCKKILKILSDKGDERVVWDRDNGREAKQAKKRFEKLLKEKYLAFSVDAKGKKNRKITEFDVDAEEILMVPPTVKL